MIELPVHKTQVFTADLQTGFDKFVAIQGSIAVPMLTLGEFDQHTSPFPSLPIISITIRDGVEACDIFDVQFHRGHIRSSVDSSPDSVYVGRTRLSTEVFKDRSAARGYASWRERDLGFTCEDEPDLCYHRVAALDVLRDSDT
jgi:hypothetical protein